MAYQITLTDDEYAALTAAAAAQGETVEALVHAALAERYPATEQPPTRKTTDREFLERLYHKGIIMNIPDGRPDTPKEEAELEELANSIGPGKPASETVIEDRRPR